MHALSPGSMRGVRMEVNSAARLRAGKGAGVCYSGAMKPSCREAIAAYICAQANPPDKCSHQPRLYALAKAVAGDRPFDDDILYAAAWLHDLGVFIGHRPADPAELGRWDNVAYAMERAPSLLQQFGFPAAKIPAVVEAIRTHQPAGQPGAWEGVLLRDADILEQLGAVGVLRTVSKVGRDTRFTRFGDALQVLRRSLDSLPGQLRLDTARRLAEPRVQALRSFLAAAETEAGGIEW
jgi:uncharacterized protein